jgi:uncharacterized protein YggE
MTQPVATVRGEASLQGPPDLATLSVTVHRSGDSAARVRADLAAASALITQVVEPHGAALESSSTTGLHVGPVFNSRAEVRKASFRGSYTVSLVVHDFDQLSPLVTALSGQTSVQLDGPWWSLRPQNPLQRQARLAAITDARLRADDYAAALGAHVVDVLEVSDLDGGFGGGSPRAFAMAKGASAEQPEFDFQPAVQTVTGQVTVRFALSSAVLDARS